MKQNAIRLATAFVATVAITACAPTKPQARDAAAPPSAPAPVQPRFTQEGGQSAVAPLLEGIGPVDVPISTDSPMTRRYFNQALTFVYGFNHAEAVRSFQEAARHDATCGICYWGVALALGPNINRPMPPEAEPEAFTAVQKALALRGFENAWEQAYIDAVATRYAEPGTDRAALDMIYAGSMAEVVERFPDDLHAATLYAESLMDLMPWNYWADDGAPREHTPEAVAQLERVIDADPEHPGALHLYIHAMEQYTPQRAESAADRLGALVPVAGHLVHMPSHIYLRVGRYHDAVAANMAASAADETYIAQCNAQGFYPAGYYPHNIHFLWYAAVMEGRRGLAVESARKLVERTPLEAARAFGSIQVYLAATMFTAVRFGMWDAALAEPAPPQGVPYATAMWHYGRGVARAATGDVAGARAELAALSDVAGRVADEVVIRDPGVSKRVMEIAVELVAARIARAEGRARGELEHLRAAVDAQDALPYTEPPFWHYPVRHSLGEAYLRHGEPAQAAAVFAEDLGHFPANGWSLYGMERANAMLGTPSADVTAARKLAWQHSDVAPAVAM